MSIFRVLSILSFALFLASCEKKEDPYQLPVAGPSKVITVGMTENYGRQVFLSLASGDTTGSLTYGWDLAFECGDSARILTNSGKDVMVYNTGVTDFNAIISTAGAKWDWDRSNGADDSLVIGKHWHNHHISFKQVYLIDLSSLVNTGSRYKKMIVESVDAAGYHLRVANVNGTEEKQITVPVEPDVNYVYLDLVSGTPVPTEPHKALWHVWFTRYKTWVSALGTVIPYNVTGVYLNPNQVTCTKVVDVPFEQIDHHFAQQQILHTRRDVVGYEWKGFDFDFTSANYRIYSNWTYILKDAHGFYYKMRFLDFYDANRKKGYPKIEYQQL